MILRRRNAVESYAGDQAASYRRGFVLGLTLAETVMLLTFVILLLLVAGFERRDGELRDLRSASASFSSLRNALGDTSPDALAEEIRQLRELKEAAQAAGHKWDRDFLELVKTLVANVDRQHAREIARQLAEKQKMLSERLEQIKATDDARSVIEAQNRTIDDQNRKIADMASRERELRQRNGGTLPSCWRFPNDREVYVFDMVLEDAGIRLRDRTPDDFLEKRASILGQVAIDPSKALTASQLLAFTQPLFDYSKQNDCRFYVEVYDGTGAAEKARYKQLLSAVEEHFYKLLSADAPPY